MASDIDRAMQAWDTALVDAKYATKNLYNSFGLATAGPGGWSTANSASAWDPSKLLTFNKDTGIVGTDQAALGQMGSAQFGVGFGYNKMTDVMGQGASNELTALANLRSRGVAGGGLAQQARTAAESMQGRGQAGVVSDLISSLGQTYGNVASTVGAAYGSGIDTAAAGAASASDASAAATTTPPATATPPPNAKAYQRWTSPQGIKYQFINGKWKTV